MRRLRAVYCIPTRPTDRAGRIVPGMPVVGYVGQTRQTVKQREGQHRDDKPFSDLIVGGSFTVEEGWWTEAELDARERHCIKNGVALMPGDKPQRPIYNYEHNLDNPARVEIWRQKEQRRVREPGWEPAPKGLRVPQQRGGGVLVSAVARIEWTPARIRAACWFAGWLAVAVWITVWVAGLPRATAGDGLAYGAGVASVLVGVLLPSGKRRRRRRR